MRENLLSPRFIKAEDEVGLMITGCIRADQMIETEDMMRTIAQDRTIKVIDSEKILEKIIGRILGKGIEVREIIVMIELGTGIGQETEILQGVMERTGALTAVDPGQDPEQIQIGTE